MIILPWIFFWLLWRVLVLKGFEWREAFLAAFAVAGVCITLSTEILTLAAGVRLWPLVVFWALACGVVLICLLRIKNAWVFKFTVERFDLLEKILLAACACILGVVGFIAVYAPPNTWDSMTYHMARVGHWAQNGGVMNYPTNIIRQLVYPPYAEYAILHAQILSHSDRFANLVQWTALAGSAIGASLAARALGGARLFQVMTALFVLTMPMAILQGSSTQNDLVLALWVISAVVFFMLFRSTARRRWALFGAMAFGLAVLTKPGGLILVLPFIVWVLFTGKASSGRKFFLAEWIMAAVIVLTGAFHVRLAGIDPDPYKAMALAAASTVEAPDVSSTISNMVRGAATELALPWPGWNEALVQGVGYFHRFLGRDVNDPHTTYSGYFSISSALDEDYAPSPVHMFLLIAAMVCFCFISRKNGAWAGYLSAVLIGGIVFCALMKWQPWINRLHLPFFVLAMPFVAVIGERLLQKKALFLLLPVLLMAIQPLALNNTRSLVSDKAMFRFTREQLYFAKHWADHPVVLKVSEALRMGQCTQLGVVLAEDSWEYPWMMAMGDGTRVEHLEVNGPSGKFQYPLGTFTPCAIVAARTPQDQRSWRLFAGVMYVKVGSTVDEDIFAR